VQYSAVFVACARWPSCANGSFVSPGLSPGFFSILGYRWRISDVQNFCGKPRQCADGGSRGGCGAPGGVSQTWPWGPSGLMAPEMLETGEISTAGIICRVEGELLHTVLYCTGRVEHRVESVDVAMGTHGLMAAPDARDWRDERRRRHLQVERPSYICTVQYCTALYCTVPFVLYSTVQCYGVCGRDHGPSRPHGAGNARHRGPCCPRCTRASGYVKGSRYLLPCFSSVMAGFFSVPRLFVLLQLRSGSSGASGRGSSPFSTTGSCSANG